MPDPAAAPVHAEALVVAQAGTVARQEFGAQQLARSAETAAAAVAAHAEALVKARYVMALQRPRDLDDVRVRLLKECKRPGFAQIAWYRKPVGKGVEGFSIRFAEAAMRCLGNLMPEAPVIYDDAEKRILRATVTDLENNLTLTQDVVVEKTVERSSLKEGQTAISVRMNSQNKPTYLVPATEDELLAKSNAQVSKALRTLTLRILPGDIADECKAIIRAARDGAFKADPDGERKKVADAFAELNVMPAHLKAYLGHDLGTCSPAELDELRGLYTALKEGETTWSTVMAERAAEEGKDGKDDAPPAKPGLDGLAETLKTAPPAAAAPPNVPAARVIETAPDGSDPRCPHPDLPEDEMRPPKLLVGVSVTCKHCGRTWTGAAAAPASAPGQAKTEGSTKGGRQGRLQE